MRKTDVDNRLSVLEDQFGRLRGSLGDLVESGDGRAALDRFSHRVERVLLLLEELDRRLTRIETTQEAQQKQAEERTHRQEARFEAVSSELETKITRARELLGHRIDNERKQMVEYIQATMQELTGQLTQRVDEAVRELSGRLGDDAARRAASIDARVDEERDRVDDRLRSIEHRLSDIQAMLTTMGDRITSYRRLVIRHGEPAGAAEATAGSGEPVHPGAAGEARPMPPRHRRRAIGKGAGAVDAPVVDTLVDTSAAFSVRLDELEDRLASLSHRMEGAVGSVDSTRFPSTLPPELEARLDTAESELGALKRGVYAALSSTTEAVQQSRAAWEAGLGDLRSQLERRAEDDASVMARVTAFEAVTGDLRSLAASLTERLELSSSALDLRVAELHELVSSRSEADREVFEASIGEMAGALQERIAELSDRLEASRVAADARIGEVQARVDARLDADQAAALSMLSGLDAEVAGALGDRLERAIASFEIRHADLGRRVELLAADESASVTGDRLDALEAANSELRSVSTAIVERLEAIGARLQRQDASPPEAPRPPAAVSAAVPAPAGALDGVAEQLQAAVASLGDRLERVVAGQQPSGPAVAAPATPAPSTGGPYGGAAGGRSAIDPARVPTGMLRRGARGDAVRQVQELLAARGFAPGAIDGVYGSRTADAVGRLQADLRARGLFPYRADGVWSPKTAAAAVRLLTDG